MTNLKQYLATKINWLSNWISKRSKRKSNKVAIIIKKSNKWLLNQPYKKQSFTDQICKDQIDQAKKASKRNFFKNAIKTIFSSNHIFCEKDNPIQSYAIRHILWRMLDSQPILYYVDRTLDQIFVILVKE